MKKLLLLLVLVLLLLSSIYSQSNGFIKKFELKKSSILLSRIAQPTQYFDKIGRKAALMGFEDGSFEMWVWPWKPLRNFEILFFLGSSTTPIKAKDIVRTIDVTPEATRAVIEKELPGMSEAMRAESLKKTPNAMISRAICGIRKQSLIINLPGSPRAVRENLAVVLPAIHHAVEKIKGSQEECGTA